MRQKNGFTLAEMMVVVGIIMVITIAGSVTGLNIINRGKVSKALSDIAEINRAAQAYYADVSLYPPDTVPGVDPGFISCPGSCPSTWRGPYMEEWVSETPWGGLYDWNNWQSGAVYPIPTCGGTVPRGIYVAVYYSASGTNAIPRQAEEYLIAEGIDRDLCVNSEAQILFKLFE